MTGRFWLLFLCGLSAFTAGSLYAWSALSGPLAEFLSQRSAGIVLTGSDLSSAFALAASLAPLTMLISGYLSDRTCPKNMIFVGALVMGFGLFQCAQAKTLNEVVVYYGLFFGLGLGLVYGSLINYAIKLFPDKKGFAGGLVTAAYSLGSVVLPPIVTVLYLNVGIDGTFRLLGIATAVIIGASACWFKPIQEKLEQSKGILKSGLNDLNWHQMLGTRRFYVVYCFVFCASVPAFTLLSHADYLSGGISSVDVYALAWMTSLFGVANVIGRMSAGVISDCFGRQTALVMSLFTEMIGLVILMIFSGSTFLLGAVFALIGYAFGAAMGVIPAWVSDLFGTRNSGLNYGIAITGVSVAGVLGPIGFLGLEQIMGSRSLTITGCLVVLSLLSLVIGFDRKSNARTHQA